MIWKYIFNATRGRDELFDLVHDAHEQQKRRRRAPRRLPRTAPARLRWINTAQQPRTPLTMPCKSARPIGIQRLPHR